MAKTIVIAPDNRQCAELVAAVEEAGAYQGAVEMIKALTLTLTLTQTLTLTCGGGGRC